MAKIVAGVFDGDVDALFALDHRQFDRRVYPRSAVRRGDLSHKGAAHRAGPATGISFPVL
jgi:hypothetical protein